MPSALPSPRRCTTNSCASRRRWRTWSRRISLCSSVLRDLWPLSPARILPQEQVPSGATPRESQTPPAAVLVAVMDHMTSLAERREIARMIVGGVVVEMGAGQHHAGAEQPVVPTLRRWQLSEQSALAVAPSADRRVPPSAIAKMQDLFAMGAAAPLAPALSSFEADHRR